MENIRKEPANPIETIKKENKYILQELASENHQVYAPLKNAYEAYKDYLDSEISKKEKRGYRLIIRDNLGEVMEIVKRDSEMIWRNQKVIKDRKTDSLRPLKIEEKPGVLRRLNDLYFDCLVISESFSR